MKVVNIITSAEAAELRKTYEKRLDDVDKDIEDLESSIEMCNLEKRLVKEFISKLGKANIKKAKKKVAGKAVMNDTKQISFDSSKNEG